MGVVTYIPRVGPLMALAGWHLPGWLLRILEGFPVAVLAAFVVPLILAPEGSSRPLLEQPEPSRGVLTTVAAVWSRSLIITVVVGAVSMMVLRAL